MSTKISEENVSPKLVYCEDGFWEFRINSTSKLRIPLKAAQDIAAAILTETPVEEKDGNFEF